MIIALFNAMILPMLLNLDNGAAQPSQKKERNRNPEQNRRYFSDADSNVFTTKRHIIVKN